MGIKKYIYAFIISLLILILGVYLVNSLTESKIEKVRSLEAGIAINILSLETQFALLQELSCKDISQSILSSELDALAQKLQFMENNLDPDDPELIRLKKYYSLLEIKDFILLQKINKKCEREMHYILYFYSNEGDCKKCKIQGPTLSKLLRERDNLRIYNFDYNLDLSATETLKRIYAVRPPLPALVIDGKLYRGFTSLDILEKILPNETKESEKDDKNNNEAQKDKQNNGLKNKVKIKL